MNLIGTHTSPYVRKARIVLAEKKIEYDFLIDSPWLEGSGVPNLNPLGKIPVLILDDDTPLFDSRVIVQYIDSVTPNNKLFPAPNRERIEVKRWEALADGICDAAATASTEGGLLTLTQQEDGLIAATGIATWARLVNGNEVTALDLDCSGTDGTGDVKLASTNLYLGGDARMVSAILG